MRGDGVIIQPTINQLDWTSIKELKFNINTRKEVVCLNQSEDFSIPTETVIKVFRYSSLKNAFPKVYLCLY